MRVVGLSLIMPTVRGPSPAKQRLLILTAQSINLYGAETWGDMMDIRKNIKSITQVQRKGAIRIAYAYCTVSETAILVISRAIPIDLLAKKRRLKHLTEQETGGNEAKTEAWKIT